MPDNDIIIPPVTYGVWLPHKGWLRDSNGNAFADLHREVAVSVAHRMGSGARVEYIDLSLVALQVQLLEAEEKQQEKTLWHILKTLLRRLTSK